MSIVADLSTAGAQHRSEDSASLIPSGRMLAVQRLVLTGIFVSLVWKWSFFVAADHVYHVLPIQDDFFPGLLQSQTTLRLAFLGSLLAIIVSFFASHHWIRVTAAWTLLLATTVMCVHQGSYNDMTFATAWWTSLWSLWFASRMEDRDESRTLRRAGLLSRLILSMILLGGAIGKWTPEYWSGEVLYQIYFVERDFWVFNALRTVCTGETLREIATWYSRKVILIETVCGFGLWLLPPRAAAIAATLVFASIALLSNLLLFSVLSCLIGLALVNLFVPSKPATRVEGFLVAT